MVFASFHQPFESILNTDDIATAHNAANGDGTDDAVDAGCRPAADEHTDDRARRTRHKRLQRLCVVAQYTEEGTEAASTWLLDATIRRKVLTFLIDAVKQLRLE